MNKKIRLLLFALIAVLPVLIYLNSLGNTFVYDDYLTVTNNHFIREWRYLSAFFNQKYFAISNELTYRPVVTFSYFVDYSIWQLKPWGYHLTNLIIHTLNVCLVYFAAYCLFGNRITAFISCLLFSLHPIFSEAVNAISYREDLLSATFLLAAFILFVTYKQNPTRRSFCIRYPLSLLAYLLAMLSKETAIVLPLLILSYEFILKGDPISNRRYLIRRLITNYAGYTAIGGFYLFLRFSLFHNPGEWVAYPGNSIFINFIMMTKVIGYYLKLLVIPAPLNADYVTPLTFSPADGAFIVSAILLIITAILLVKKCRLSGIWTFSVIWFFVTLLPVLNIIPINNIIAERYLYIPGIGFMMLLGSTLTSKRPQSPFSKADLMGINASLVSDTPPPLTHPTRGGEKTFPPPVDSKYTWTRLFRIVSITLVCLLFTWCTVSRNRIWLNEFTFSTATIRRSPESFRVYNNLGFFYYQNGLNYAAIQAFKDSIKIRYEQPKAHCNLGAAYALKGFNDAAIEELAIALRLRNEYPEAHNNLGILYKRKGMLDNAVNEYVEALKVNPYYADAHNNLGSALIDMGRLDEALSEVEKAVKIRRNFALAHYNIAVVYFKKGQINEAYNKLLESYHLDPTNADVHISLGVVYLDHFHDKEKALHHIKEALRLNPRHKQAEEMKKTINKLTSPENKP